MKGSIIFNGNIQFETEFIEKFKENILNSNHNNKYVRENKPVLLITAAWQKREFKEEHIKQSLYSIGIKPIFKGAFDQNVKNLSLYHNFNFFKREVPDIYDFYHSKQEVIKRVKLFYREKNSGLIKILQKQLKLLKNTFKNITLYKVLSYNSENVEINSINQWELLYHYACKDIQATMKKIRDNDKEMIKICKEIDEYFFINSKVNKNTVYIKLKNQMEQEILNSNSIFIFGGHIAVLFNRLNFFKLKDAFFQALENGTNFYTVSAGSLCLCENIIVFDDNSSEWTSTGNMYDFELFDFGFGLVKKIQIFPHCKEYIDMNDPDTITYTTSRFSEMMCVGLDQKSFLLLETYKEGNKEYERFLSVGKQEGVYIFNNDGSIKETNYKEELMLPGTKVFENLRLNK
ncbi:MAG: hypothetical protein KatS3mg068_0698 [Candidatus Sericytochromatia bacterium]|nr:MAG: hypothetical protein KatS3mg068_0698 [Candidatus Sericytochromatia bacterium]